MRKANLEQNHDAFDATLLRYGVRSASGRTVL